MSNYKEFIQQKSQLDGNFGFEPIEMPDMLFDFQKHLVEWSLRKGRAAIFADCGMGKTPMQLVWALNVHLKTGKPTLIIAPLAVAAQTVREGDKFGVSVLRSQDGTLPGSAVVTTNYERVHLFDPSDFGGVVCDESSILKSFTGSRRAEITEFMSHHQYRLLATATAAPNDWVELGASAEALGVMSQREMMARFFTHNSGPDKSNQWRLKGHAKESVFWRWVASWARALRRPSDLGYKDDLFVLPPLNINEHIVNASRASMDTLFALPAIGLNEQRKEARATLAERCHRASDIVNSLDVPAVLWCHLNDEADTLARLIPDSVEVAGRHSSDYKEDAAMDFINGNKRVLITKPRIFGWGLNFQHCARMTFFPSHSYEAYYQAVRRCWRFGQQSPVTVDVIATEGSRAVLQNLQRKSKQADRMFEQMVAHMHQSQTTSIAVANKEMERPSWL